MSVVEVVIAVLIGLIFITTSFQFVRNEKWFFRIFDFPHIQMTILNIGGLVAFLLTSHFNSMIALITGAIGFAVFIYQAYIIYPYTFIKKKTVVDANISSESARLSILEANVLMYNNDYDGLVELVKVHSPDLVIALETDTGWQNGLKELELIYPYALLYPLDNTYGICLYSRFDLTHAEILYLVNPNIPSIEATLEIESNVKLKLFVVHPMPPSPEEHDTSTPRDAELIIIGKKVKQSLLPVIVAGDLNDVAWSHTTRLFLRTSGLLDPRMGRGFFNTFNAKYPLLRWPLDHIFVSTDFSLHKIKRLPNFNSDHFPIYIALGLPREPPKENESQDSPDQHDVKEGHQKIEKAQTDNGRQS